MTVERYDTSHWDTLREWFEARGTAARIDPDSISPFGGVVSDEAGHCLVGWLYIGLGTNVCFLERLTSRPGCSLATTRAAAVSLLEFLRNMAVLQGVAHIYAHIQVPALRRSAEGLGFELQAEGLLMHKQLN